MSFEEYDAMIRRIIVQAEWCDEAAVSGWIGGSHLWRKFYDEGVSAAEVARGECDAAADQHS